MVRTYKSYQNKAKCYYRYFEKKNGKNLVKKKLQKYGKVVKVVASKNSYAKNTENNHLIVE